MAKPQKNLRVGPKIIIIFSFQNFFVRFLKEQQILPKHCCNLLTPVDCTPSVYFSYPSHPSPLFQNLPWAPVLLFPCSFSFLHSYQYCFFWVFFLFILPSNDWFLFPWCLCLTFDPAWLCLLYLFSCKQRIFKTSNSILSPLHVKNYKENWIFHLSSKEEAVNKNS